MEHEKKKRNYHNFDTKKLGRDESTGIIQKDAVLKTDIPYQSFMSHLRGKKKKLVIYLDQTTKYDYNKVYDKIMKCIDEQQI